MVLWYAERGRDHERGGGVPAGRCAGQLQERGTLIGYFWWFSLALILFLLTMIGWIC